MYWILSSLEANLLVVSINKYGVKMNWSAKSSNADGFEITMRL